MRLLTLAFLLLMTLASTAILAGRLLMFEAIRPSFTAYTQYLPGEPRPAVGCREEWDAHMAMYNITFDCEYILGVEGALDKVYAYGTGDTIKWTLFAFGNTRYGDVLALLGNPYRVYPGGVKCYRWRGMTMYVWRGRHVSLFARQRFLSLSGTEPT